MIRRSWSLLKSYSVLAIIKILGLRRIPWNHRNHLYKEQVEFEAWIARSFHGSNWSTLVLKGALVQPFKDLLNKPAGGEAYCGGIIFDDPSTQPTIRHYRGTRAIDRPLVDRPSIDQNVRNINSLQFWCGPLAFHFGHQIADFGSRVLLSSIDPRDGELLWMPWKTANEWSELSQWQKFLLTYLNPAGKKHNILLDNALIDNLVVVPQQARMFSSPTLAHLDALSWCQRQLQAQHNKCIYLSRSRFSPGSSRDTLRGSFAAEWLFEKYLLDRGVKIIYPETLSLKNQLEMCLGAESIIVAEGSAQHILELLGYDKNKKIIIICRRPQSNGMDLPLLARFPQTKFVNAIQSFWRREDDVSWNGLAMINWLHVSNELQPIIGGALSSIELNELSIESSKQFSSLSSSLNLVSLPIN